MNRDTCARCGLPLPVGCAELQATTVWFQGRQYHTFCAPNRYAPNPPDAPAGATPFRALTEADVRRIVREEIAAASIGEKK